MIKINNQDLRFLAEKYNSDGKQAMYAYLQSEYGIKNPTCTFKRMKKHPELGYHPETDRFLPDVNFTESEDKVFMTIDELCASNKNVKVSPVEQQPDKSKEESINIQWIVNYKRNILEKDVQAIPCRLRIHHLAGLYSA